MFLGKMKILTDSDLTDHVVSDRLLEQVCVCVCVRERDTFFCCL